MLRWSVTDETELGSKEDLVAFTSPLKPAKRVRSYSVWLVRRYVASLCMYSPFPNQFLAISVDIGGVPERATALESSVEDLTSY